jgi:thiol-disulfide isomerase/thioredoxin
VLWQSIKAPNFEWTDSDGTKHTLNQVAPNKPAVVALVLGNCPRCDTQFAMLEEKKAELNAKGIELIAIASTPENLRVFKQMWSFDEFESIPIHGLFVLNAERDVVWQDVSAEAFLDIDFLMNELQRSLSPVQSIMVRGRLQK